MYIFNYLTPTCNKKRSHVPYRTSVHIYIKKQKSCTLHMCSIQSSVAISRLHPFSLWCNPLALSYYSIKDLLVIAKMTLLDIRYLRYLDACVAIIETTLNAGTIFFTLFPNFNIAIFDKYLSTALKVQLEYYWNT